MRKNLVLWIAAVVAALAVGLTVPSPWRPGDRQRHPDSRMPFLDEAASIDRKWSILWDTDREKAKTEDEWRDMREKWRAAYGAEVRTCYERHGRTPPEWTAPGP